jgi:hypothetical protein
MNNRDIIKTLEDIMLCLQAMIRNRFGKKTKIIYTRGKYKSAYLSFYKNPYLWQFYVEDRVSHYMVYLLKNEKIIRKEMIRKEESVEQFYRKILYFFRYM